MILFLFCCDIAPQFLTLTCFDGNLLLKSFPQSTDVLFSTLGYSNECKREDEYLSLFISNKQASHFYRETRFMYICNVATTTTDRDSIAYTERVESMYFAKVHSPLGSKSPSYRKKE